MESETTARLERILLKIVEHADSGMAGSSSYALDRLKAIRDVATYGIREAAMPSTKTTDRQSDTPTEALIMKLRASAALCWPNDIKRQTEWADKQLEIAVGGDADGK